MEELKEECPACGEPGDMDDQLAHRQLRCTTPLPRDWRDPEDTCPVVTFRKYE